MRFRRATDSREFDVEIVARDGKSVRARIDGREVVANLEPLADGSAILEAAGKRVRVFGASRKRSILVALGPLGFELIPADNRSYATARGLANPEVTAPMPGKILKVLVNEGDRVEAGQGLVVMEAMKMETTLAAEAVAIVKKVRVAEGQMVDHGDVLIELSPLPGSSTRESAAQDS
jgi:biotin carboxyl carrier protein